MRLPIILVVARAEVRSNRRLTRYWVFAVISTIAALGALAESTFLHGRFSYVSAAIGVMGPRYLIASAGSKLLLIFLVGLVFLAFDIRARDERDRMTEVLDSRPLSNAEFLLGKVAGLVFVIWIPLPIIALLFGTFGLIASSYGFPYGDPVESFSLLGFLLGTLTSLLLWCSIIVLITVVFRARMVVATISLALIGLQLWSIFNLPIELQRWLTIMPAFDMASDILPRVTAEGDITRIVAHWIMASSFLCLAIALHPRRDGSSVPNTIGSGVVLLAVSVAALSIYFQQANRGVEQQAAWRSAHEAKQTVPRADMQSLSGTLIIQPGDQISMELDLELQAPLNQTLSTLLLTFNPGLGVTGVQLPEGDVSWAHQDGLLEIIPKQPITPGSKTTVSLQAAGVPDELFGYLDTYLSVLEGGFAQADIGMLGVKTSIFASAYVAMMPGAHWFPATGTDVPQSDPRTHPQDYFTLDLEVEIPAHWLVAGPGRRQKLRSADDKVRYRFNPKSPMPHVGLIASRFKRRTMLTAGVEFEVLLYPEHDRNLKFFEDSQVAIRERLDDLFTTAEDLGLAYPYDGLSLVETPNALRGYGGGWMMDTVQSMPGVMLLRENSFPTSRFETRFLDPENFADKEGGIGLAKLRAVEQYFENDINGGNLFTGGSRNFLQFQTSAEGEGAHAVNFVLDELILQLLTGKRGHFSAHEFNESLNTAMWEATFGQGRTDSLVERVQSATTHRPSVWDRALGVSLADLEFQKSPRMSLKVLTLKSHAIARSILDGLGREKTAALLAELVRNFRGRTFHITDLYRIASDLDIELEPLLGDWLHDASLPGFLLSAVKSVRLKDDDRGNPRYQTQVHIRNDEPTPGLLQLRYQWGTAEEPTWDLTDPIRVPGHTSLDVGIVTSTPLFQLWTQPYLSLNRVEQRLSLPRVDGEQQVHADPFAGIRASDWEPTASGDIIIDDLDSGFTIWHAEPEQEARSGPQVFCFLFVCGGTLGGDAIDMDQGLPEQRRGRARAKYWRREVNSDSWGRYRHTYALVHPGGAASHAVFRTTLPRQDVGDCRTTLG
jgi:ABC-type transport system involved in multi-copper enzyme maturation permease subunit